MKRVYPKQQIIKAKQGLYQSFLSRIIKNTNHKDCWHLNSVDGSKIVESLCHYSEGGTNKMVFKIKRFSYEYFRAIELPANVAVYSSCHNKYCLNPNHHYTSTLQEYVKDLRTSGWNTRCGHKHRPDSITMMSASHTGKKVSEVTKSRMSKAKKGQKRPLEVVANMSLLARGERNPLAKLNETDIAEIRGARGHNTAKELAGYYNVSKSHICNIWRRVCWKHI